MGKRNHYPHSFNDSISIFQALTFGTTGYLLKNLTFEEIQKQIIQFVIDGKTIEEIPSLPNLTINGLK